MQMKKKTKIISISIVLVLVFISFAGLWGYKRMERAKAIQQAIANPEYIDPAKLLNQIDDSFVKLPQAEKNKIVSDPKLAKKLIADATFKELNKSYKLLFILPPSIRKKVIQKSADDLRKKALKNPEKVAAFFESPAGSGSLRGASKFFLLGLSGKQKSESAPLTQAMYKIVKRQAYQRREK